MNFVNSVWKFVENEFGYMLYILALILMAMMIDLIFATIVAKVQGRDNSKIGINGMLRKITSIILLVSVLLIIPIVPFNMGVYAVTLFYLNYLRLEVLSLNETYKLINGNESSVFENLIKLVGDLFSKKYKEE